MTEGDSWEDLHGTKDAPEKEFFRWGRFKKKAAATKPAAGRAPPAPAGAALFLQKLVERRRSVPTIFCSACVSSSTAATRAGWWGVERVQGCVGGGE